MRTNLQTDDLDGGSATGTPPVTYRSALLTRLLLITEAYAAFLVL